VLLPVVPVAVVFEDPDEVVVGSVVTVVVIVTVIFPADVVIGEVDVVVVIVTVIFPAVVVPVVVERSQILRYSVLLLMKLYRLHELYPFLKIICKVLPLN
jgi:hypothetical protein